MRKRSKLAAVYGITVMLLMIGILWGSEAVTVLSENAPIEWEHCFIIDAGHGGVDGGATSCTGKLESAYNLEIALKLNDFMHFLGCHTKMIRTEDVSIHTDGSSIARKKVTDLKERVRICNETEDAILLSIHQNTFPESRYSGAQVFYANSEDSEALAKKLQSTLVSALNPSSRRNAKQGNGIYLLEHIGCPGILIECGFLSNPQEEARLRSDSYQKELCCVIGITAFLYTNT